MDVEIKRDGIILRGKIEKPYNTNNKKISDKYPALIIFHGFAGDLGYDENSIYSKIANRAAKSGMYVIRFDFDGHGKSDGKFSDMDVLRELLDAIEILKYVQKFSFITDIYVLGHSQGCVVGGMLAGLYPDIIKKLVLLAPAATLKEDAIKGICMGTKYDTENIPEMVLVDGQHEVGGHYFRIAKSLAIYETTKRFIGATLIIHGINDMCVDYHASEKYNDQMKNSILKLYPLLDHGIEGEDQDKVLNEIDKFLTLD